MLGVAQFQAGRPDEFLHAVQVGGRMAEGAQRRPERDHAQQAEQHQGGARRSGEQGDLRGGGRQHGGEYTGPARVAKQSEMARNVPE